MNNKKQVKTQDKQGVRCLKTTSFKLFFFSRITGVVSFSFRIALLSILCRIFFCFPLLYVVLCIEHILCDFFLSHEQTHQNTYTNSHPRHQAFFSYISSFSIHTHTHRETPIWQIRMLKVEPMLCENSERSFVSECFTLTWYDTLNFPVLYFDMKFVCCFLYTFLSSMLLFSHSTSCFSCFFLHSAQSIQP